LKDYSYVKINLKNIDEMEFLDFQNSFPLLPCLPETSCVDILTWLSHGINPNHVSCLNIFNLSYLTSKSPALYHAVAGGKLNLIKCLIDNGADKNFFTSEGFTAIILAAGYAEIEIVDYFLHTLTANVNQNSFAGTPLIFAVGKDRLDMVEYLIKNGANVNLGSLAFDITPLMLASLRGNFPIVQTLLKNDAEVNTISFEPRSALHCAVIGGSMEIVQALLEHGAEINYSCEGVGTPFSQAVKTGNIAMVQFLLNREDINVNLGTRVQNKTPLMIAVENEQFEITRALLRHPKIEINNIQIKGIPALHYWSKYNTPIEIIERLIKNCEAKINTNIDTIGTPLHISASQGNFDIVNTLLAHGANVNIYNNDKKTPLMLATSKGFLKIVKALLEKKAKVNESDIHGISVIHMAAKSGHLEVVQELRAFGANLKQKSSGGQSILDFANQSKNMKLINLLRDLLLE
jgi:ankyrin repeat protein